MKILSKEQVYEADKFTIEKQQISSDLLMERAAEGIFNWMHQRLQGNPIGIHVFCGIGNNGGDGLALARMLREHNYEVTVYVVNYSDKRAKDFLLNLDRLKERKLWPEFLDKNHHTVSINGDDIIVDAIFGIGLNRPPSEWVGNLIQFINKSGAFVLSVDIPSGLSMDRAPKFPNRVIQANYVLSFQTPKLPFLLPDTGIYINQWELLDIGLDPEYLANVEAGYQFIGKLEVLPFYRPRLKFSHKGNYGHTAVVGGSYGKIGAIQLAVGACLATGSGLVTAYVPRCGYIPIQTAIPEAMVLTDEENESITAIKLPFSPSSVAIGMGMGTDDDTAEAIDDFLDSNKAPLVIDADGLNILAKKPKLLQKIPAQSVLTPHPKELKRLVGTWEDDFDKLERAKEFSKKYECVLLIKGAHTAVIYKDKGYFNATGNPGMATAGSGDALAGVIAALVAQGYPPLQAAIFGVYLHGLAGDIGSTKHGYEALTASGITENIGQAFLALFDNGSNKEQAGEN